MSTAFCIGWMRSDEYPRTNYLTLSYLSSNAVIVVCLSCINSLDPPRSKPRIRDSKPPTP